MKNKQVRDLAWVVNSPSLIQQQSGWPIIAETAKTPEDSWVDQWLLALDNDPSALNQHLSKEKSHFLGTYFESLWAFYLISNPRYELIAKNLQANTKSRTEGEFDFIVVDKLAEQYIHQEIAIKFYLGLKHPNNHLFSDGESIWLGPQCRDRLDLKMDKMLSTQIKLASRESGKQALRSINIDPDSSNFTTQLVMKGYLFYPPDRSVVAPNFCSRNHLRGQWFKLDEFKAYIETHKFDAWAILTKSEWVSQHHIDTNITSQDSAAAIEHQNHTGEVGSHNRKASDIDTNIFNQPPPCFFTDHADLLDTVNKKITTENRPWMVACLIQQKEGHHLEAQRLFVVPENWPHLD